MSSLGELYWSYLSNKGESLIDSVVAVDTNAFSFVFGASVQISVFLPQNREKVSVFISVTVQSF